ncbi:MAG: MYXO-CTERM sorting domain-containing protein, partial [Polyangiales bacterium]
AGRLSLHDNVFVDVPGKAIYLADHNEPLKLAWVYNNTIYSAGTGIQFGNAASEGDAVIGNLVFARTGTVGIAGPITNKKDNLEQSLADATTMVKKPSVSLTAGMDFYPLAGKCTGAALDLSAFTGEAARDVDFNGTPKSPPIYRGAYHGSGDNPGWPLGDGPKDSPITPPGDAGPIDSGGSDAAGPSSDSSPESDSAAAPDGAPVDSPAAGDSGGCGCRTTRNANSSSTFLMIAALALLRWRTRSSR